MFVRQCCCSFTTEANFGYVVVKYFDLFEENRRRFDFSNSFQPNFIFKINKIKFLDGTGTFASFSFLFFFFSFSFFFIKKMRYFYILKLLFYRYIMGVVYSLPTKPLRHQIC